MERYVIETRDITKVYGEQTVVNKVNLHVQKGRIYGPVSYTHLDVYKRQI